jgi:hypothetical protein
LYNIARALINSVYRPLALTVAPTQDVPVAALLGVAGGFVVPTILMFTPFNSFDLRQKLIAFWQPSPVYVGLLAASILRYTRKARSTEQTSSITTPKDEQKQNQRQQEKRKRLISVYNLGLAATTLGHWLAVYTVLKDTNLSLSKVFLPSITPRTEQGDSILNFMQWDMGLYVASAAVHGLQSIF